MANVALMTRPRGILGRTAWWYSRKTFGRAVEPARAAALHRGVTIGWGALEMVADKGWRRLDPGLRWLATQSVAGTIGCSWCTDFGYYAGMQDGVDPRKVQEVPNWRTSDAYDERERAVLEYAEAATSSPVVISDDLMARLHAFLGDPQIVELAAWVALENLRSRFNGGLGMRSEGFADQCELKPLASGGGTIPSG
jgi:alkylhydroperoxidase family enzyme